MPVGIRCIERKLPEFLEDAENGLSGVSRALFARLLAHFRALDRQVDAAQSLDLLRPVVHLPQAAGLDDRTVHRSPHYLASRLRFTAPLLASLWL